jgi:hypothetical protein
MRTQQQAGARRFYPVDVPDDETTRLRLENQRLRDRVAILEGMFESLSVGIGGSLDAMLEWMKSTRLPPPEGDQGPVLPE